MTERAQAHEEMTTVIDELMLDSPRPHELTQAANLMTVKLQTEINVRKLAEAALAKSAAELAAIQTGVSEAAIIAVTDVTGRIEQVNDNFVRISKYSREELIGQDHRLLSSGLHPKEFIRDLWVTIANGKVWRNEIRNRAKDGSLYWVDTTIAPILNERGKVVRYMAVRFDVTARKLAEAEQQKLTQRLREANEEIQRFAHVVSHDMRSPLINIIGFTNELDALRKLIFERFAALRAQVGGARGGASDQALCSDVEEALNFISSSTAKMDRLIGGLLKLSREGQRQFQPQFIDMSRLLRSTFEALAHQARDINAKVSIGELPTITSDRFALEQVFSNLMDNAVKYLRVGVPGSIEVGATESDGEITYEVRDNGRGIDPRDHEGIFDLFRRSGIQDRPGDGIGLAHTRALVRRLGGSVNVESELDRGTVFKVTLPKSWPLPVSEMTASPNRS